MQVPKDPNLYLTVFTGICVTIVMMFWILTPEYTPHLEEESEHTAVVKPEQALGQVDAMLTAAETTLAEMDVEKGGGGTESTNGVAKKMSAENDSGLANVISTSVPDAGHDHAAGGHDHAAGGHDHAAGDPGHDMSDPGHDMSDPGHDMSDPGHDMGEQHHKPEESSHSHDAGGDHGH